MKLRKIAYNNNTDYSPLGGATPGQLNSFMEGMHQKKLADFDSLRGPLSSNDREVLSDELKEQDRLKDQISKLRSSIARQEKQGVSTVLDRSLLSQLAGNQNSLAKKNYNPSYGRGMGLMDSNGGYGGVSFNKF